MRFIKGINSLAGCANVEVGKGYKRTNPEGDLINNLGCHF